MTQLNLFTGVVTALIVAGAGVYLLTQRDGKPAGILIIIMGCIVMAATAYAG